MGVNRSHNVGPKSRYMCSHSRQSISGPALGVFIVSDYCAVEQQGEVKFFPPSQSGLVLTLTFGWIGQPFLCFQRLFLAFCIMRFLEGHFVLRNFHNS